MYLAQLYWYFAQATIILIGHNLDLMLVFITCIVVLTTYICKTQHQNVLEAAKKNCLYWILCQIFPRNVLKKSSLLPHSMRTTKEKSLPLCVPNEINSAVKQKSEFLPKGSDTANHQKKICVASTVIQNLLLPERVHVVLVLQSVLRLQSGSDFLPS